MKKIAILGEGVTGKAIAKKLPEIGLIQTSIEEADLIVTSPGIPPNQFPQTSKEIISEIEFAYRWFQTQPKPPVIIGITGTNGKSTVTALLAHILDAPSLGNIGIPLVSFLGQEAPVLVVELSSYQLECCTQFRPDIGVILNITPDHLERHGTMEAYAAQKAKLFQSQTHSDTLIYNEADPLLLSLVADAQSQKIAFSRHHPLWEHLNHLPIVGDHNKLNALAAFLAAEAYGMKAEAISPKLFTFKPLEHRIEPVVVWKNRSFYNDSKGTNPDSTMVAVKAFSDPVHLILGGKDKGLELDEFLNFLTTHVNSVCVYGEIGPRVFQALQAMAPGYPTYLFSELNQALEKSVSLSQEGEVILFSPACSSFDQFRDFNHRGDVFKFLVGQAYGNA